MKHSKKITGFSLWVFFVLVLSCAYAPLHAQTEQPSDTLSPVLPAATSEAKLLSDKVLLVGIHEKPPLAFQDESDVWQGVGVRLWEIIAKKNNWRFVYQPLPVEGLIPALTGGKVDIVVGELLVNPVDEQVMDFSQPFLETPIRVAVSSRKWNPSWFHLFLHVFDWTLIQIFLAFAPILLIVSIIIWRLERLHPKSHFEKTPLRGIGSAFWFSAVTMTSTGFGDKVPVTFWGRTLAIVWMLLSLLLMTAFTASVASAVASAKSASLITSPEDLRHYRNGVLKDGVCAFLLHANYTPSLPYETFEEAFDDLVAHRIDTVIGEAISLKYLIHLNYPTEAMLLPVELFESRVAFGIPSHSPLRDPVNIGILEELRLPEWQAIQKDYLGDKPKFLPLKSQQK